MAGRAIGGAAKAVGGAGLGCLGRVFGLVALVGLGLLGWGLWSVAGHVYYLFDGRAADAAAYAAKANVSLDAGGESLASLTGKLGPPTRRTRASGIVNATDYCWYRDCKVEARVLDGGALVSLAMDGPGLYGDPVFQGTFNGLKISGPAPGPGKEGGEDPGFYWKAENGRITLLRYAEATFETPASH